MKLKLAAVIGSLSTIVGVCAYAIPTEEVNGNSDWTNETLNTTYSEMLDVASSKSNELKQRDVNAEIRNTIEPTIEEEKALLEQMLEDYYQMRIDGLADTPEYIQLEETIRSLKQQIFDSYKAEIDLLFE